jgi:hypothetical protein
LFRINTVFACTYFIKLMSFIDRDKFLYFLWNAVFWIWFLGLWMKAWLAWFSWIRHKL